MKLTNLPVTKRNAAKLCRAAANRIEAHGLAKGAYKRKGAYCALGAMGERSYDGETWMGSELRDYAVTSAEVYMGLTDALHVWNDNPMVTKENVCGVLRRTARWLEHGGGPKGYKYGETKGSNWKGEYV